MSREVRRVPLDFDHPLREVWPGYLRPDELDLPQCPDCAGSGEGPLARYLDMTFYCNGLPLEWSRQYRWDDKLTQAEVEMLAEANRLHQFADLWDRVELAEPRVDEDGDTVRYEWVRNANPMPTAAEVNTAQRDRRGWGHDGINRWKLVRFRCERIGEPVECPRCAGSGDIGTPEQRAAHEAWESTEPPTGEGWQLWETTSEGSPTSPVFATGDELAVWMSQNPVGFAGARISLETAMSWVHGPGWAPSMVFSPATGLQDGITAFAREES